MDHDKIKELICLNCESYEFFNERLQKIEEEYFVLLDELLEALGSLSKLLQPSSIYQPSDKIINKLRSLRNAGHDYITTSIKFEIEMEEMRRLAPDLADVEIEFDTHKSNFKFLRDYLDELEQSLMLQQKMRDCITKQLELFKGYE